MSNPQGTDKNPLVMKIQPPNANPARLALMMAFTIAPVALAILMQHPALRQQLQMRFWWTVKRVAGQSSKTWGNVESIAQTHYDIARL